ncbi:MAG: transglycosylase SLT domain-containing protein [Rhodoferax sp.]
MVCIDGLGERWIVDVEILRESVLRCWNCFRGLVSRRGALSLLAALSLHAPAWADVWKYVDENGVTQFTNQPPGKAARLVIQSDPASAIPVDSTERQLATDANALRTVAVMNASPAYQAVQGNLAAASTLHGVDYELLKAVVVTESAFDAKAVSNKGAVGLMQIMPATARRYGVHPEKGSPVASKLTDPEINIQTGTRYLADLLRLFGGQTELAVAAYNAGEGAVMRAGNRIPDYKETQLYVVKVMSVYRLLQTRS